jgi:hypothetical protein
MNRPRAWRSCAPSLVIAHSQWVQLTVQLALSGGLNHKAPDSPSTLASPCTTVEWSQHAIVCYKDVSSQNQQQKAPKMAQPCCNHCDLLCCCWQYYNIHHHCQGPPSIPRHKRLNDRLVLTAEQPLFASLSVHPQRKCQLLEATVSHSCSRTCNLAKSSSRSKQPNT